MMTGIPADTGKANLAVRSARKEPRNIFEIEMSGSTLQRESRIHKEFALRTCFGDDSEKRDENVSWSGR